MTPIENFEAHMTTYANSKGFVANSNGQLWDKAKERFENYSDHFKSIMPYQFFLDNVISEPKRAEMHPIFSQLLKPFGIR